MGTSKDRKRGVLQGLSGLALASATIGCITTHAMADDLYDGSNSSTSNSTYVDGGDWFNPLNWDNNNTTVNQYASPAVNPVNQVPEQPSTNGGDGAAAGADTINLIANTGYVGQPDARLVVNGTGVADSIGASATGPAAVGVVYNALASPNFTAGDSATTTCSVLYLGSTDATIQYYTSATTTANAGAQANALTLDSGTIEAVKSSGAIVIGRYADGVVNQNGGTLISDSTLLLGQETAGTTATYNFYGGTLQQGISSGGTTLTGSSIGLRAGNISGSVGVLNVHNSATAGSAITLDNAYFGYVSGSLGIANFYYENGGVTTVNVTGGTSNPASATPGTQGQLSIRNYAAAPAFGTGVNGSGGTIGSILNLTLNEAPTVINGVPENLALFTYAAGLTGETGDDKDFFSTTGTDLTQGSTISETFDGTTYSWTLSYDGSIAAGTPIDGQIPSADILGTGGVEGTSSVAGGAGAVVLIGQSVSSVPEPASAFVGALTASFALLRRRRCVR